MPKRYFDRFPLDSFTISDGFKADDLDDLPKPARWLATHRGEHEFITSHDLWKRSLQAYYASIAYVDEQIGRVLDALDAGPNADDTIVVFMSDNGWHTGEKNHWSKFYLSELACKVVFSVSVPGAKPQRCDAPVSLLDIYPTLAQLCDLPQPTTHELDGVDLSSLIRGESTSAAHRSSRPTAAAATRFATRVIDTPAIATATKSSTITTPTRTSGATWRAIRSWRVIKSDLATFLPKVDAPDVEFSGGGTDETNAWSEEAFR